MSQTALPQAPAQALPAVLAAQFLSALADNALLFIAIALVKSQQRPDEWVPLLQEFFVLAFVILAPFAGPFADAWPKGRVMILSNGLKLLGAVAMLAGLHPLLSYGMVGVGAAAYSPAKYGILSELVSPARLVKANSWMEGSTIVAILLGVAAGGWLADWSITLGLIVVASSYFAAMLANLAIPRLPAVHPLVRIQPWAMLADFGQSVGALLADRDARFSLACTSLFWGSGATLRLLLVAWVPLALGMTDASTPANLNGAVAVGIAVGAALASGFINLESVNRSLWPGLLLGPVIIFFTLAQHWLEAVALLTVVGVCGGLFVVPLNALLQERGHESVGAGHAVAVQNLFENLAMLGMLGLYAHSIKSGANVMHVGMGFGGLVFAGLLPIAVVRFWRGRHSRAANGG